MESQRLTPLDTLMPRTYISTILTFRTTEPTSTLSLPLQTGLEHLFKQLPWLSGRVYPVTQQQGENPGLEIRWHIEDKAPALLDKGSTSIEYEALSLDGMPPADIPAEVWPAPSMIDEALFQGGAPVFAASIFRFRDNNGLGLCVCMHHNVVDAIGFAEVLKLWTDNMGKMGSPMREPGLGRIGRLSNALSTDLSTVSTLAPSTLFASHTEYSNTPPSLPTSFPPCTCKLFRISSSNINSIKERLAMETGTTRTTNAVLSAIIWSAVTRARMHRDADLEKKTSRLVTAVNGRRRISEQLSTEDNPYLGNVVLYSLAELAVPELGISLDDASSHRLATVCDSISQSQSTGKISARHIAEVYRLADSVEDYRTIFPGWDLFGGRDLTITSWADLGLYDMDFGAPLGKPNFVRVRYAEADGVAIILPRNKPRKEEQLQTGTPQEVIDVMLMLRFQDMEALEQDNAWRALTA